MPTPKLLAQGSYGCVYKPSLHCEEPTKITYDKKVSKFLTKEDAKIELAEYKLVKKSDPRGQYYLGVPETCTPAETQVNQTALQDKCDIRDNYQHLKNDRLIIMKDGGENLSSYADKIQKMPGGPATTQKIRKLWVEVRRLFQGIRAFLDHDLIHHDLKGQNIVYDEATHRLNYIDFGLMERRSESVADAIKSTYAWSKPHWSFPWESTLANQHDFDKFVAQSYDDRDRMTDLVIDKIMKQRDQTKMMFFGEMRMTEVSEEFLSDYRFFYTRGITQMTFPEFIQKHLDTVDIYGVGIALHRLLRASKRFVTFPTYQILEELFYEMVTPDLSTRIDIEHLMAKYDTVLVNAGWWKEPIGNSHTSPSSVTSIPMKPLRTPDSILHADPTPASPCPPGKERNPMTGRCVKSRTVKLCPAGKERNPKTGRCIQTVKLCSAGKERNPKTGRCIQTSKLCPAGKERNPKTGRCKGI